MKNDFWLLGIHRNILAEEKDTDGNYDMVEGVSLPGVKTPLHIHSQYSEIEYVLEGELTVHMHSETVVLKSGERLIIPKGTPHSLAFTGSTPTKTLTIFSPAGFAQIIRTVGIPGSVTERPTEKTLDNDLFIKLSGELGDITLSPLGSRS